MPFTEDARVKIPAILHLTRLGFGYLSLKHATWDPATNIFPDLFRASATAINPGASADDIDRLLQEISLLLENEDLGKAFHERLTRTSGLRLIDFEDFDRNSFHVVTELTCKNGDDEFRPDITLLINGLPLIFTEVKKPNNRDGILAERNRINARFRNPKFRRFVNLTQWEYYYNASIADGYTLRLIREEIETQYKLELAKTLEEIEVLKGRNNRTLLYAHEKFIAPMLDYIVADFEKARLTHNDPTIGAMVICDSADQAKKMAELFALKYAPAPPPVPEAATTEQLLAADHIVPFRATTKPFRSVTSHALILHDVGTKDERKQWVEDFKAGKIDILFVYNMLLTGFDSPRLKKLYLGRVIKAHNLLQALTPESTRFINALVMQEYLNEFNGQHPA